MFFTESLLALSLLLCGSARAASLSLSFNQDASNRNVLTFNSNVEGVNLGNGAYPGYEVTIAYGDNEKTLMKSYDWVSNQFSIPTSQGHSFPNGQYSITIAGPFACVDSALTNCARVNTFSSTSVGFTIDDSISPGTVAAPTTSQMAFETPAIPATPIATPIVVVTTQSVDTVPPVTTPSDLYGKAYTTPALVPPKRTYLLSTKVGCSSEAAALCPESYSLAELSSDSFGEVADALASSGLNGCYWLSQYNAVNYGHPLLMRVAKKQIVKNAGDTDSYYALCQST